MKGVERMKVTKWQDADYSARVKIYDRYCEESQDFGFDVGTFEEFDAAMNNSCFEAAEKFYGLRG